MHSVTHENILGQQFQGLPLEGLEPSLVQRLYAFMLRLRRCEQALMKEYHPADEMRCPIHFCIGQEAAPAALSVLLELDDFLFSHHRSHGYFLAKNAPMKALFAELYGRATGANGGKAGSQDISSPAQRVFSGAILTGAVAIAVGAGLGIQMQGRPQVAVAGFGEAATEEGIFWEAVNFAVLRRLPVIFVCENNRYSMYSPQLKRQPADDISRRVAAFGMSTQTLFGNDVVAVHQVLREAIADARSGKGPCFIESYTYRWNGHVGPEDDDYLGYRPEAERAFWHAHCPVALLERRMVEAGMLNDHERVRLEGEIDGEIADAFHFAKTSPFPEQADWRDFNMAACTPLADRLLTDWEAVPFNEHQRDTIPGPY